MRNQQYFKVRSGRAALFTHKMLGPAAQGKLGLHMLSTFSDTKHKKSQSIITLEDTALQTRHLFCKTKVLRHRNLKIRSTFNALGLGNRSPAIAEIKNNLNTSQFSYIPNLFGYGYERNAYGLIDKVVIITEFIEGSMNLREFMESQPDKIKPAMLSALDLIGKSIRDGVMHLDCWIENILTDKDLSNFYLIDLEYCRLNTKSDLVSQLSFCLGYFYSYGLAKYMSNNDYFSIIEIWLQENFSNLDIPRILIGAKAASADTINRKQRLIQF